MSSLCDRTGARLAEVRSLFAQDFSKLELGAKVRSYLAVLTTSNVRAMSRRKGECCPGRQSCMTTVPIRSKRFTDALKRLRNEQTVAVARREIKLSYHAASALFFAGTHLDGATGRRSIVAN